MPVMNDWVPCVNCGRKSNMSPRRGITQQCRYCGGRILWTNANPETIRGPMATMTLEKAIAIVVMVALAIFVAIVAHQPRS